MGRTMWVRAVAGAVLAAALGASCGGSDAGGDEPALTRAAVASPSRAAAGEVRASTTSTPRARPRALGRDATTTTTSPGAPAPVLRNRGTNYVAIYHSLDAYRRWLEAQHPDPALVQRVWVPGTKIAAKYEHELAWLRARHLRWLSVDDSAHVEVASVVGKVVSLRVDQHLTGIRVVDASGAVVGQRTVGPEFHWIVLLSDDGTGRWTIAAVDARLMSDVEVHL